MDTAIRLREARTDDLETLARWAEAMAWETEHKRLDPQRIRGGLAAGLADPRKARYFIAEREGRPAGTLMLTGEWSDWRNGWWWWIQSVYVAPEQRRRGVYAALYRHVEAMAAAQADVCGLRLYVERDNAVAQATYEHLGMSDAGYRMYEIATRAAATEDGT
jgi:GNAT superfamily N-acetyltransferase